MLGGWIFSSIGANAPRVTLTLNYGGKGVVSDRKGLNISPIYSGTNWGVRHAAHPSWYRLALWCFHVFFLSKFLLWKHLSACCWSYSKLRKTLPFRGQCNLCASRPMLSSPWCATYCKIRRTLAFQMKMRAVSQCAKHYLVTFYATFVSPVQFFSFPRNRNS